MNGYWQINSSDGESYYADTEREAKKELKRLRKKRCTIDEQLVEYRMFFVEDK